MESLSEEDWDVVIAGTSLSQSLLALALSKCDVKVLHVDQNDYYGGLDAGLSLDEIQKWINRGVTNISQAEIIKAEEFSTDWGPSRSYTISLNPQIIYAKSRFLPTLVSSQIHTQLEFQAVGAFYVLRQGNLAKIPSNREDVFADDSLSVRDKRKLMNLLRYVVDEHDEPALEQDTSMQEALQERFKLPQSLNGPVQALSLTTGTLDKSSFSEATTKLKRHFMSMGYFGPGLAAVMAKYGGNSEIAQVACRAGAVGGFVYLLGQGVASFDRSETVDHLNVQLSDGVQVKTRYLVGTTSDLPSTESSSGALQADTKQQVAHHVSIVSNPLKHLFTAAAEGGSIPAVAIILAELDGSGAPPVYLQIHSEETGECPAGKCIIYASTTDHSPDGMSRLQRATSVMLETVEDNSPPKVLWSLSYRLNSPILARNQVATSGQGSDNIIVLPDRKHDLALDDSVIDHVKVAWVQILGERSSEYDFLQFEERRDTEDEE